MLSTFSMTGCSETKTATTTTASTTATSTETNKETGSDSATATEKEDTESTKGLETAANSQELSPLGKKVLPSAAYIGKAKMGYIAAQRVPEICQKIFCYCGCDYTDEHASLLDCFTSDHGVDCIYCQGEAVMAYKMSRKGSSVAEIQKAIDLNWGPKYPFFEQPSDQIKKYWKTRLWAKGNGPTPAEKHNDETPLYDPFSGTQDKNSKPMGKAEDCCGKKDGSTGKPAK